MKHFETKASTTNLSDIQRTPHDVLYSSKTMEADTILPRISGELILNQNTRRFEDNFVSAEDYLMKSDIIEEMKTYSGQFSVDEVDRVNLMFFQERSFWKLINRLSIKKNKSFDNNSPLKPSNTSSIVVSRIYADPRLARISVGISWLESVAKDTFITDNIEKMLDSSDWSNLDPDLYLSKTLSKTQLEKEDARLRIIWCYLRCGMYSQAVSVSVTCNVYWRASLMCGKEFDCISEDDSDQHLSVIGNCRYSLWHGILHQSSAKWSETVKTLENTENGSDIDILSCARLESAISSLLSADVDILMNNPLVVLSWDDKLWSILKCYLDSKISNKLLERDQMREQDMNRVVFGCFDVSYPSFHATLSQYEQVDVMTVLDKYHLIPGRVTRLSVEDVVTDPTWLIRSCSLMLIAGDDDRINLLINNLTVPFTGELFELYGAKVVFGNLINGINWSEVHDFVWANSNDSIHNQFIIYSKSLLKLCFKVVEHCMENYASLISIDTLIEAGNLLELYCLHTLKVSCNPFYLPRMSLLLDEQARERVIIEAIIDICSDDEAAACETNMKKFFRCFENQEKKVHLPFLLKASLQVQCSDCIDCVHKNLIISLISCRQITEANSHVISICRRMGRMNNENWVIVVNDLVSLVFDQMKSISSTSFTRDLMDQFPIGFTDDDRIWLLSDERMGNSDHVQDAVGYWNMIGLLCLKLSRTFNRQPTSSDLLEMIELYLMLLSTAEESEVDLTVRLLLACLECCVLLNADSVVLRMAVALLPKTLDHFNERMRRQFNDTGIISSARTHCLLTAIRKISLELLRREQQFVSPI